MCWCVYTWKNSFVSADINECSQTPEKCGNGKSCKNYPGTYRCYCDSPGTFLVDGNCTGNISLQVHFAIIFLCFCSYVAMVK